MRSQAELGNEGATKNDVDPTGADLYVTLVTGTRNGDLSVGQDGSFTYIPDPFFVGADSFYYVVSSSNGYSNVAQVTLTVTNAAPMATADSFGVHPDTMLTVAAPGLLRNDSEGYKVEFAGYETKAKVVVTVPRPTGNAEQDYKKYIEYRQKVAKMTWEAGKKSGWKEAPWTSNKFLDWITDGTKKKSLLGTLMWGHGGPAGFQLKANVKNYNEFKNYWITYNAWEKKQSYKLGVGVMYACSTAHARSADPKKGAHVFSTNAIFWGADKILVPPLVPPEVAQVLRQFKEIKIGPTTFRPPNVQKILDDHKEIK